MSWNHILVLAAMIAGCLWCIAGDVKLALTIYPKDAVDRFSLGEDGAYRLDAASLPSFRRDAWIEAMRNLCRWELATETEDGWMLTSDGAELRECEEI